MKKLYVILCCLFTVFSIVILPTAAKYQVIEFGDIFHVNFTKFSVFAEEFVVEDDKWQSDVLWGTESGKEGSYNFEDLKNVAFSARNNVNHDVIGSFTVSVYLFKNTDSTLTIELANTSSPLQINNIVGTIRVNKGKVTSNNFEVVNDSKPSGNYDRYTFTIDPLDYYKTVTVNSGSTGTWWTSNSEGNIINTFEYTSLEEYFVMNPGEVFEYNINISNVDGNNSGDKSWYPSVKMYAETYVRP